MNKEQRAPYLALGEAVCGGVVMCDFCRFAVWSGGSCDDSYWECDHPIGNRSASFEHMTECMEPGQDCWGFRPRVSFEIAHGMATNYAAGKGAQLTPDLLLHPKKVANA